MIRSSGPARPGAARRPLRPAGFSLIEVVVALLVLTCGALAVASTGAAAARAVGEAEVQTHAVTAAAARIERLASAECAELRDGTDVDEARGLRERWTITPERNGARLVAATLEYVHRVQPRTIVLNRLLLC